MSKTTEYIIDWSLVAGHYLRPFSPSPSISYTEKAIEKRDEHSGSNLSLVAIVSAIVVAVGGETSRPDVPNMTWVYEYGVEGNYYLAWNPTGITDAGTPVLVAKSPTERTILGVNTGR